MTKTFYAFLLAVLMAIAYLVIGTMDFADAPTEQARYCRMVDAGAWPDYRNTYESQCADWRRLHASH